MITTHSTVRGIRSFAVLAVIAAVTFAAAGGASARPAPKGKKAGAQVQNFLRQDNVYSNVAFKYTNRGVLFNSGANNVEALFWPRGSGDSYVFGEGLWFATKKDLAGKRHKLCELGYNPNSGAGWYNEGEANPPTDGADPAAKYISYVGPRYDKTKGTFLKGTSNKVPSPYYSWPLWDTSTTKTLKHNFYFGDYISDVSSRNVDKLSKAGKVAKPAIISEEDIVNIYTDADPINNPEFKPNSGYPFGIDIQEVIYSWSFGRYRDMVFVRQKVTNTNKTDSLLDCWIAPAFDPDLDAADGPQFDHNSFVDSTLVTNMGDPTMIAQLRQPYRSHPEKLNMGIQWHSPSRAPKFGMIGFSFLESPAIDSVGNIVANDDSVALRGYGPNSLFQQKSLGLVTFRKWRITNDPSTQDLRYDFVSAGIKEGDNGIEDDMRLLMATGPFTLPPGKTVETVVALTLGKATGSNPTKQTFSTVLQLTDFAHQVFGEVDSTIASIAPDTTGKMDTTYGYYINHFLSPVPPDVPNVVTQSLDKAVFVHWDSTAERSVDPVSSELDAADSIRNRATLPFLGYQLWRTTRSDHDSTIRPTGANPNVMLGQWQLYDYATDSVFDGNGHFNHLHYRRTNSTPHEIPHSYLDVGDDNHDGQITGTEGLINGVKYYYYVIAFDEYDSLNQIGPLYTAIVPPKNFVVGIPSKPVYLTTYNGDSTILAGNCAAGGDGTGNTGGLRSLHLSIIDTGRFATLYTNDTISVRFQPRWVEYNHNYLNQSNLQMWVDVTDSKGLINNTYATLHKPTASPATESYYFPTSLAGNYAGALTVHVNGTVECDSVFPQQFTTDNSKFAPNQAIGQAFRILADVNFEQLCTPYKLKSITTSGQGDPSIIRLSERTNIGSNSSSLQNIDPNGTRPSFLGGLGEMTYEMTFGQEESLPSDVPSIPMPDGSTIRPNVMPVTIKEAGCDQAVLHHVNDSTTDMQKEVDISFYSVTQQDANHNLFPAYNDPDTMFVPNPGWFEIDAWHFADQAKFSDLHTDAQGPLRIYTASHDTLHGTVGPYYFPMRGNDNVTSSGLYHLTVHRLKIGGAEIIFNAPEINAPDKTGDTTQTTAANAPMPHTNDFQPGDKVTIAFTGMMKNLPFPQVPFTIQTESGSNIDPTVAGNYNSNVLNEVQVVPNPYIVTWEGQTSTDNAKLMFTRLPPRCTIEIYALDGTLVNTIEHNGYYSTTTTDPNNQTKTITNYDYSKLGDRSTVEEWNLLTSGKQRVGSQVLFARVISRDPNSLAEIGETTTKFAVVVGISK